MRPLLDAQVLAAVVPADVHQHRRIQRAAPAPRRARRMRALALERVFDRHQAVARAVAPVGAPVAADVREDDDVGVFEVPVANVVRLGREQLFGHARPQLDGAGDLLALHDLLQHDRRRDVQRHARVVSFAVARSAFEERIVIGHARLLRSRRDAVDIGSERDDRFARSPRRHPRRRDAGDPLLDGEPLLAQDVRQVLRRFDLLEPELAEAEDGVDHLLREVVQIVDTGGSFGLQRAESRLGLWIDRPRGRRRCGRAGLLRVDVDDGNGRETAAAAKYEVRMKRFIHRRRDEPQRSDSCAPRRTGAADMEHCCREHEARHAAKHVAGIRRLMPWRCGPGLVARGGGRLRAFLRPDAPRAVDRHSNRHAFTGHCQRGCQGEARPGASHRGLKRIRCSETIERVARDGDSNDKTAASQPTSAELDQGWSDSAMALKRCKPLAIAFCLGVARTLFCGIELLRGRAARRSEVRRITSS